MKITIKKPRFRAASITQLLVSIGANTLSQVFLLIIVLIALNIFSQKFFLRLDLTKTHTYSLSSGTKNILQNLEDTVTIETYFSENIPPDLIAVTQDVKDMYEEYKRFADGKVQVIHKNPKDENFKTDATNAGVPEIQFSEFSQDKYEVAQGFLGAAITYKDKKEVLELITEINNLEFETSSRIYKLTHEQKQKVGFLTGHSERGPFSDYTTTRQLLERQFSVETVSVANGAPINPDEIKVLVIAAPSTPFSQRDMFEIDQYIMRGGRVMILADLYELNFQQPLALNKNESNINDILKHYGAEVESAVLLDESFQPITAGLRLLAYPYWILTQKENIFTSNPALAQIESTVFFWAHPIKEARSNDEQKFTPIIKTTDHAWKQTGDYILVEPDAITMNDQQQFTLAALLEGKQVSMFKDQEIPALESGEGEGDTEDKRTAQDVRVDEVADAKIVLIADSDIIFDQWIGLSEQNTTMFANLVEWLASSEELIEIRSKNVEKRPLQVLTEGEKNLVRIANIALLPIVVASGGFIYNAYRRKKLSSIG